MNGLAGNLTAAVHDALAGASIEVGERRWAHEPLNPWLGWLIVALMRQIPRQRWVVRIVDERLRGPVAQEGGVPGFPGWTYRFHGIGCCLAGQGESIDVDFYGDGGLTINTYFFATRVLELAKPGLPEARVRELLPTAEAMREAIRELQAAGIVVQRSQNTFRLAPSFEELVEAVSAADFESLEAQARWPAHLGDFEHLVGHARVEEARRARRDWFLAMLDDPEKAKVAVTPLEAILPSDEFLRACAKVIDGPLGAAVGVAIERLDEHPELPLCDAVLRLLGRMVPGRDHPFAMHAAAHYLLRRGIERERAVAVFLAFARIEKVPGYNGNPFAGDFALLALEFAQEHALELLRAALRSRTPIARQAVAAALSGLAHPWCRRELLAALDDHSAPEEAAELLAALTRCGAPEALEAAGRWLREHPPTPHSGPGYTWEEVALTNAAPWLEHEIEQRRAWIARVAATVPENLDLPA